MKICKKVVFAILVFLFCSVSVFASSVNAQIDEAIKKKDAQQITKILNANKNSSSLEKTESYILKKARDLVSKGELDFALEVTLCVVDSNMENFEALDLYSSIDKAIKKRDEKAVKSENLALAKAEEKLENEKKQKENNRKKNSNLVVENEQTGEIVYIDQNFNNHYASVSWKINLGLFDFTYFAAPPTQEFKYGLMFDSNVYYHGDIFSCGIEFLTDISCLNFVESAKKDFMYSSMVKAGFGLPILLDYFFLSVGYFDSGYLSGLGTNGEYHFSSPLVGFTVKDIHFGKVYFETSVNYFIATAWKENIKAAGDLSFNFFIQLADLGKVDLGVDFGVKDILFVYNSGIQNQTKFIFGIEVFSNE